MQLTVVTCFEDLVYRLNLLRDIPKSMNQKEIITVKTDLKSFEITPITIVEIEKITPNMYAPYSPAKRFMSENNVITV